MAKYMNIPHNLAPIRFSLGDVELAARKILNAGPFDGTDDAARRAARFALHAIFPNATFEEETGT